MEPNTFHRHLFFGHCGEARRLHRDAKAKDAKYLMEGYAGASTCMMAASERQRYFQADLTSCGMMRSRAARSVGVLEKAVVVVQRALDCVDGDAGADHREVTVAAAQVPLCLCGCRAALCRN